MRKVLSCTATPLVSIIVPARNAGNSIARALDGIRNQTYSNWELIVIEDGSCDGTDAIVREFERSSPQGCKYERNECNLGVSATRNRALSFARGDLIAFLDADDWWTVEHLACGASTLQSGADFCYSGFRTYDEAAKREGRLVAPTISQQKNPLIKLFEGNFIQTSSVVMLCRRVADRSNKFDTELRIGEDVDFWLRLLGTGHSISWTGKSTCFYSKHSESAMAKALLVAEESVKLQRKHLASSYLPLLMRKQLLAAKLLSQGRLLWNDNRCRARHLISEAYAWQPLSLRCACYAIVANWCQ